MAKILYYNKTPRFITFDLEDAEILYVQDEYLDEFKAMNPDITIFQPYNFKVLTVNPLRGDAPIDFGTITTEDIISGVDEDSKLVTASAIHDGITHFINENKPLYAKATSADLVWTGTWYEGGNGDLTRVELVRNGNIVQMSGCVRNETNGAAVGSLFTIPTVFRPTRKISWVQMSQQWFQIDGQNRAASYFCQLDQDGKFGLDKMNIGGVQTNYQANKNLFISGMWIID